MGNIGDLYFAQACCKIKRLFWDQTLNEECFNKYPLWVVKRVLEYGTLADVMLLIRLMGKQLFLERVSLISFSSDKTEQFWSKILNREGFAIYPHAA